MMPQVHTWPDTREISKKGQQLFEVLSPELAEKHRGQFVTIEVDSGDYFIGETGIEATQKAQVKHPGKVSFSVESAIGRRIHLRDADDRGSHSGDRDADPRTAGHGQEWERGYR